MACHICNEMNRKLQSYIDKYTNARMSAFASIYTIHAAALQVEMERCAEALREHQASCPSVRARRAHALTQFL